MSKSSFAVMAAAASVVLAVGCENATDPVQPESPEVALLAARHGVTERTVTLKDACDPTTFNAVVGPGTCVRQGGVTFENFVAQLQKHQRAGGWFFAPKRMSAKVGDALLAVNRGGEEHTFTEVAEFGGGIVPFLNDLLDLDPAPECLTLGGGDFVPPDGTFPESVSGPPGERHFQCCIHPWMRTTVVAR